MDNLTELSFVGPLHNHVMCSFLQQLKILCLPFALSVATVVFGQSDTSTTIYLGGSLGFSAYTVTVAQNEIPVTPFYQTNAEAGIVGVLNFKDKFLSKTGIFFTYYRSPFVNNISTYNEFIQIPIIFSFLNTDLGARKQINLLIGPQISILTRYGVAKQGEDNYEINKSSFGDLYKFGVVAEAGFFNTNASFLNSFGLKCQMDIPALTIMSKEQMVVHDNFVSVGIYYNLNKKASQLIE